jgi:uncharacterized membrane protein
MFNIYHLHPMVVHFPIALILVGFLFDFLSVFMKKEKCLSRAGLYLEVLGLVSVLVAVGTGYFFTSELEGVAGQVRETHELFAFLTLGAILVSGVFRIIITWLRKDATILKYVALGLFLFAFVFVSITGYIGGDLVMTYLIGM